MKSYFSLNIVLSLIFTVSIVFFSCSNSEEYNSDLERREDGLIYKIGDEQPYTGTEDVVLEGKRLFYEVVDGKKNGVFKIYNKNGVLEVFGHLKDNKYEGEWNYFYPEGKLESKGKFKNDVVNGEWKWYYRNGNIKERGFFENGERIGLWKMYDNNGELVMDSTYSEILY